MLSFLKEDRTFFVYAVQMTSTCIWNVARCRCDYLSHDTRYTLKIAFEMDISQTEIGQPFLGEACRG